MGLLGRMEPLPRPQSGALRLLNACAPFQTDLALGVGLFLPDLLIGQGCSICLLSSEEQERKGR